MERQPFVDFNNALSTSQMFPETILAPNVARIDLTVHAYWILVVVKVSKAVVSKEFI